MKKVLFLLLTTVFLLSCPNVQDNSEPGSVKFDFVFKNIGVVGNAPILEGNKLISPWSPGQLAIFDATSGKPVYSLPDRASTLDVAPVRVGENWYQVTSLGKLVWYDQSGKQVGLADPKNSKFGPRAPYIAADGNRIYWGISGTAPEFKDLGLAFVDVTQDILPDPDNPGKFLLNAHIGYATDKVIWGRVYFKDNVLLLIEYPERWRYDYTLPAYVVALDRVTLQEKWRLNNPYFVSQTPNPFVKASGDTLIVEASTLFSLEVHDDQGSINWQLPRWGKDGNNGSIGGLVDGEYFYQAATIDKYGAVLTKYRISDGHMMWRARDAKYYHIHQPQLSHGIIYIISWGSLRMYSAETGRFLGADHDLWGLPVQGTVSFLVNDLYIFTTENHGDCAVKTNWRVDANDKLYKVAQP